MVITIAICTFNRAESLRRTLDSFAAMQIPDNLVWEVVVVNNRCTDHTDTVIADFADRLPIRREYEETPGQSNARNRAIYAAKGDYIIWTDDDVVVDQGWLAAYVNAFCSRPEAAIFGGPIRPRYELPAMDWVIESEALLGAPYCIRDLGDDNLPICIQNNRLPLGANYAIRAIEQRAFRYNPDLGLNPLRHRRGEEHDVIERILQSGAVGYPVSAARVEHCIGHDRQTVAYLTKYFSGAGEQDAFLQQKDARQNNEKFILGVPRWLWRGLIQGWVLYQLHRLTSPGPVWVRHLRAYSYAAGAIKYWRRARASAM